jgi:hypothetical protein
MRPQSFLERGLLIRLLMLPWSILQRLVSRRSQTISFSSRRGQSQFRINALNIPKRYASHHKNETFSSVISTLPITPISAEGQESFYMCVRERMTDFPPLGKKEFT